MQAADTGRAHFKLAANTRLRGGHSGPVTVLELSDSALYSGSWDFTVRIWERGPELRCAAVLSFRDWVWDLAARWVVIG